MRLWSLHPQYLDTKGLIALWREALLAKKVLEKKTRGYRNHPQLLRFYKCTDPLGAINYYLREVQKEATRRQYHFDILKIDTNIQIVFSIPVNRGQLMYEFAHLEKKLAQRDKNKLLEIKRIQKILPHPLFKIKSGEIETWEKP